MPTNRHGQQTTDSGHVITESERIAEALLDLPKPDRLYTGRTIEAKLEDLTNLIMDYAHTDWSKNVRHGVALGRSDAVAMLRSVLKPSTIDVPASEIRKIITALTTEATQGGKEEN